MQAFYFQPQTDWTVQASTVLATSPDAVFVAGATPDVLAAVISLRAGGFTGTINAGFTTLKDQLDAATLENVIFANSLNSVDAAASPEAVQDDIDVYNTYTDGKEIKDDAMGQQGFYLAVTAAEILEQTPSDPITSEAVRSAIKTAKGDQFLLTSQFDCSVRSWPGTSSCASGIIFSEVNSDKRLEVLPNQPVDVSSVEPPS